jgi:hypothetical protein
VVAAERADADAYMADYVRLYPDAGVTTWGRAFHAFRAARKARPLTDLRRSLAALAQDSWGRTLGLGATLAEGSITKGLLLAARVAPHTSSGAGIEEVWSRMEASP